MPDPKNTIDHDELFKKLLTTFFGEFIELFLPEVAEYLDADGVEFLGQEYFADTTTGERRKIDILAKVKFRGQDTGFLMHIENVRRESRAYSANAQLGLRHRRLLGLLAPCSHVTGSLTPPTSALSRAC